ncbi:DUF1489 family protein [Sphingomonas lutea]|uniref:DUF1489 family protein n=1 Tax=Sphingomonas lutea TaxID=1045317 RepID=A0A7G9SI40_9SPHN|nr:DUF1489 family protein [Sphingomonas lutea]QNN67515.1 DUF1489 family protein [Sphingomonas lutea]
MPSLHLTKVAFSCASVETLQRRIAKRAEGGELKVATRFRPKRADELIGGDLYWIVKHRLVARQRILRFDPRKDGRIDIVCAGDLEVITPIPKRAHQGWRYYEIDGVIADDDSGAGELPPRMYAKLAGLGLV